MARFDWTARDRSGRSVSGALDAASKEEIVSRLQAQGLTVLTVSDSSTPRGGAVDFAARLDARAGGTVDFSARLQPAAPRRQLALPLVVAAVFGAIGAAIVRVSGWPIPLVPGIVAAVFLLLATAIVVLLVIGLAMPGRVAAAAGAISKRAHEARRGR